MSVATYVVNLDELGDIIGDKLKGALDDSGIDVDFTPITDAMNEYLPQIIKILEDMYKNKKEGNAKVKGLMIDTMQTINSCEHVFDKPSVITNLTFACNDYQSSGDQLSVFVNDIEVISSLYIKDTLQDKPFDVFIPVPKGSSIQFNLKNQSKRKIYWFDVDYVEMGE